MIKNLRIHDQTLFFLGSTGVLSGIFLTNIFRENAIFFLFLVCIISIQIIFFFRSIIPFLLVFIILFCLGGYLSLERFNKIDYAATLFEKETVYFTKNTFIRGTITEKISENNTGARYILRNITIGSRDFPSIVGIIVTFPDSRRKNTDDIISFTWKLQLPMNNEIFDYRTYLLLNNIYATIKVPSSEKLGSHTSSSTFIFIRNIRSRLLSVIEEIYPWESAKLLQWMLIGERANFSKETKKNFNSAGLTHIIAVSGFNITIILIFLSFLFRSFPMVIRLFLATLCIGFFTLLVGPQISVLRASIFGMVSYTILLSWKKMRAFSILLAVAVGFSLLDPLILNYDVSFHLSFLAVFGLLFFGDFFNRIFSFLPRWFGLRESLAMCFAAMVFTLPILLINFGQISLISPLANVLVVPLIPFIMLGGFVSMIGTLLFSYLGVLIGFPTWLWLSYILKVITWLGGLSYAAIPIDLGAYRYVLEIGYFMIIGFLVLFFQKEKA